MPAGGFFQEKNEILAPVAPPAAVGAQFDNERNRLCVTDRRLGNARPAHGQVANQRRFAGAGIAQDDQLLRRPRYRGAKGLVHNFQHRAEWLEKVFLPQPVRLPLGLFDFLGGDLAGVQEQALVFLGYFQQARVVLVAFPHRLRDEDTPQADRTVERAGGVEHLEVELVEPLEYSDPVTSRVELYGESWRGRAAGGGDVGGELRCPRPSWIGQPVVEVTREHLSESRRTRILSVKNWIVQVLHPLAEGKDLLPLLDRTHQLGRICRHLQLVHLAEEPLDLRATRGCVALHRPVKLFLRARISLAARRTESLGHDADDQRERVAVLLQRLFRDEVLGPSHADGGVVFPVHHVEANIPNMGGVAVVFVEEPAHVLSFHPYITGRGQEHMILTDWARSGCHRRKLLWLWVLPNWISNNFEVYQETGYLVATP